MWPRNHTRLAICVVFFEKITSISRCGASIDKAVGKKKNQIITFLIFFCAVCKHLDS